MILFWVGAVFSFIYHWYAPIHLAEVAFVILLRQVMHGDCVLTVWEQKLLVKAGKSKYGNSCYNHYLFQNVFGVTLTSKQTMWFIILMKIVPGLTPIIIYLK
jgi:Protein of Unknown function (DUF2784)